jgi:hypothetical protein
MYNMNLESFIKTYLVQRHQRKAFRSVLSAFEWLSGFSRAGERVPAALPEMIATLKSRSEDARLPKLRKQLHQKYELMCVYHLNAVISPAMVS